MPLPHRAPAALELGATGPGLPTPHPGAHPEPKWPLASLARVRPWYIEKNKQREVVYTQQAQDEEWKKTMYFYDAYAAKECFRIEERGHAQRNTPPDERLLDNDRLRHRLRLANTLPDADGLAAQIRTRLPDLPFKFNMLQTNLHAARMCARFGLLDAGLWGLAAHTNGTARAGNSTSDATDTAHGVLRALASVDTVRPPAKVGDAARRAVTEVQRATRAGEGERQLTLPAATSVGAGGGGPGTRRRPGTPRRERTPGRERTLGR
ncbi:hypothetical protein B0H14DRAFT_3906206 [Mycena olivaceomarginata]|nr:hypothetical protein B0H14DRAFT_3906206 [Mycena olivaceomarginata]